MFLNLQLVLLGASVAATCLECKSQSSDHQALKIRAFNKAIKDLLKKKSCIKICELKIHFKELFIFQSLGERELVSQLVCSGNLYGKALADHEGSC